MPIADFIVRHQRVGNLCCVWFVLTMSRCGVVTLPCWVNLIRVCTLNILYFSISTHSEHVWHWFKSEISQNWLNSRRRTSIFDIIHDVTIFHQKRNVIESGWREFEILGVSCQSGFRIHWHIRHSNQLTVKSSWKFHHACLFFSCNWYLSSSVTALGQGQGYVVDLDDNAINWSFVNGEVWKRRRIEWTSDVGGRKCSLNVWYDNSATKAHTGKGKVSSTACHEW